MARCVAVGGACSLFRFSERWCSQAGREGEEEEEERESLGERAKKERERERVQRADGTVWTKAENSGASHYNRVPAKPVHL